MTKERSIALRYHKSSDLKEKITTWVACGTQSITVLVRCLLFRVFTGLPLVAQF
jgi:hypothetical protein